MTRAKGSGGRGLNRTALILLAVLSLIWGSSFILIKKGLEGFTAPQAGSLRILLAALVMLPVAWKRRRSLPMGSLKWIVLFGLLEVGLPPYLYTWAQTGISSGTAGVLNSLVPLFTLLVGWFFFGQSLGTARVLGVLLGLGGALVLMGWPREGSRTPWLGLLIVLATLLYALAGNILQRHLRDVPGLTIAAFAFVLMVPLALPVMLLAPGRGGLVGGAQQIQSLVALVLLAWLGSALAIHLFSLLIQAAGALLASFVTYFIPFVALLWGILDGEPLSWPAILALGLILLGVVLVNRSHGPVREGPG